MSAAGPAERGEPGTVPPAPGVLERSAAAPPVPPPVREAEEVTTLHRSWARLAGAPRGGPAPLAAPARHEGAPGGVRAKVRARVTAAARADAADDRALIGDLIRAVDAVAGRLDDVSARVAHLELLVQEVVDRLSEDLVRLQMALGPLAESPRGASGEADGHGRTDDAGGSPTP